MDELVPSFKSICTENIANYSPPVYPYYMLLEILENMIHAWLSPFFQKHSVFTKTQHWFRSNNSSTHLVLDVINLNILFIGKQTIMNILAWPYWISNTLEMESSRTRFEVLGLGLEAQVLGLLSKPTSPQKHPVLGSRTALSFDWLKKLITKQKIT